jgi:hypothetical protein
MDLVNVSSWTGRGTPIEDPGLIRQAMQDLLSRETEFPIKVEGTHTLPYSSRVHHIDLKKGCIHLKLIRPLPHELAAGAAFDMVFLVGDQRYWAPTTFQGRENYLLYRFSIPARMAPADRRQHKRYPFRPREKAYVVAQDGVIPGHGISGPLVNLSEGGLAFRVDRVMRLDDHLRITPGMGFFDRGKSFPVLKVRDLPNLPLFEARGVLANAQERNGGIILGLQFLDLREAELRELRVVLDIRERMLRTPSGQSADAARPSGPRTSTFAKEPAARTAPAGALTPDALRLLGRRSTRLVLAMAAGPERDLVAQALATAGYVRQEALETLEQALAELRADRYSSYPLLLAETHAGDGVTLKKIQGLQRELGSAREWAAALMAKGEAPPETGDPLIRPMAWPMAGDASWLGLLDELAGLD